VYQVAAGLLCISDDSLRGEGEVMAGPSGGGLEAGQLVSIVIGALEPAERAGGVAYLCVTPFAAGQTLAVPVQPVVIDRDCYVAFVDTHPHANWGHDCRYLLIDAGSGEVTSLPRRFPAFTAADERWRVVHRPSS
jgi:hypothetical protein